MKNINKDTEIKLNNFFLKYQENFKDDQIKKIENNQKNLVNLGIYKNESSYGAYYAFYKNKNLKWINSHAEIKKSTTNLIAKNLKKILYIFYKFKPVSLIDIGCGAGHITNSLKKILRLKHVVGVDPSKYAIKFAKKKFKKINFREDFLSNLKRSNIGQFDIVYLRECYPFVRNNNFISMTKNIKNLSKLLNLNGLIVLENYSHKKGINVIYHKIKKLLSSTHEVNKMLKLPNQFYSLFRLPIGVNFYFFLSIFVKFLYYLLNKHPIYYVIVRKFK